MVTYSRLSKDTKRKLNDVFIAAHLHEAIYNNNDAYLFDYVKTRLENDPEVLSFLNEVLNGNKKLLLAYYKASYKYYKKWVDGYRAADMREYRIRREFVYWLGYFGRRINELNSK